jgi:hypothetical protein
MPGALTLWTPSSLTLAGRFAAYRHTLVFYYINCSWPWMGICTCSCSLIDSYARPRTLLLCNGEVASLQCGRRIVMFPQNPNLLILCPFQDTVLRKYKAILGAFAKVHDEENISTSKSLTSAHVACASSLPATLAILATVLSSPWPTLEWLDTYPASLLTTAAAHHGLRLRLRLHLLLLLLLLLCRHHICIAVLLGPHPWRPCSSAHAHHLPISAHLR